MSQQGQPRIVLVTSNGWGLGHLSRAIAIALAVGNRAEVTMFSFSRGLPLASQFGIRGEFCPGQDSPWISRQGWHKYVERRFELFLDETKPDVVLFDGVAPYLGVINALRKKPDISAGWLRRGMWLAGASDSQLAKASAFDFVVEPGDIASEADTGPTAVLDSIDVPPVSLLEVIPMLDREEAATALGLDPERPALLLAIGSGQPGDPLDARRAAVETVLRHEDWQLGMVSSPLAGRSEDMALAEHSNVVHIESVYPLTRYLAAFDTAISAAGYNSVHELIPARLPTLFVPKSASQTDNQIARAGYLASRQLALTAADNDGAAIRREIDRLLGDARRTLVENLERLPQATLMGGAAAIADLITSGTPVGVRETGVEEWRQPGLKGWTKRVVPPTVIDKAQRILGRSTPRPQRTNVSLDPGEGSAHLLITSDPDSVTRADHQPVEHVLEGSSPSYRQARRDLLTRFYDLV